MGIRDRHRELEAEDGRLRRQARGVATDFRLRFQFPSLDQESGEQWNRWSMQATPPDILITNYSMLNIMLMRSIEAVSYTHLRAHETVLDPVCRLLLDKK